MTRDATNDARFVPELFRSERHQAVRFREPWFSIIYAKVLVSGFQLSTVAGAAVIAKTAVAPLERLKILLQVDPVRRVHGGARPHLSALHHLQQVLRTSGWKGLYRGNAANALRVIPDVMLKFSIHDQLRIIFGGAAESPYMSLPGKLAAGSATGFIRTALLHPLSVVRTRLTADPGRRPPGPGLSPRMYRGIWDCVLSTWRRERLRGFYGGFSAAMLSTVPHLAVCFTVYDSLSALLPPGKHAAHLWWYPLCKMGMAAGASMTAQAVTYPLDTVRRRLEVDHARGYARTYHGFWHCLRTITSTEGAAVLYRGCLLNSCKVVPSIAIQFIAYDSIKSLMLIMDPATATAARI